jgi:hypothetical protein
MIPLLWNAFCALPNSFFKVVAFHWDNIKVPTTRNGINYLTLIFINLSIFFMENAVQQFENMRLLEHDINELSRKARLLNTKFAEVVIKYEAALRRIKALEVRNEKYLNPYKK